jgi:hypothetical protein
MGESDLGLDSERVVMRGALWSQRPRGALGTVGGLAAATAATAVVAVAVRRRRESARIREYVAWVRRRGGQVAAEPFEPDDVTDLPAPVRRYLETVLPTGQRHVEAVTLDQAGEFRPGGADASWRPFTATQTYCVSPPRYVWDASIEMFPFVSA